MKTQDFYQFSLCLLAEEVRIYECLPGEPRSKCNSRRQATNLGREELAWSTNLASGREKKRIKRKKACIGPAFWIWDSPRKQSRTILGPHQKGANGDGICLFKGLGCRRKSLILYWLSLCMTEESKAAVKILLLPFWRLQCPQNPMSGF